MGRPFSRQSDVVQVRFAPAQPGSRAVFLAEARTRKEIRQIRELFDMVGQLAQVVPISHGAVMSYAVQVDEDVALLGKIEWMLKTQFTFSLVERNFSDVTFNLVRSLCQDSNTQMIDLPQCGICGAADPFPTRAAVETQEDEDLLHRAYCARCASRYAADDPAQGIRNLLARDRASLRLPAEVPVVRMPEIVERKPAAARKMALAG